MTHKERAAAALERRVPDRVPTFELEFQAFSQLARNTGIFVEIMIK